MLRRYVAFVVTNLLWAFSRVLSHREAEEVASVLLTDAEDVVRQLCGENISEELYSNNPFRAIRAARKVNRAINTEEGRLRVEKMSQRWVGMLQDILAAH